MEEPSRGTGTSQDARAVRPRRPSFASPTKASMSRSNPDIVNRRGPQKARRGGDALASDPGGPGSDRDEPEGRSQASNAVSAAASKAVGRMMGSMTGLPRRSPAKPTPRPFPPRTQEDDEMVDPFARRGLRRSPPAGVLPRIEREEPDLPPTPTQAGLSDPATMTTSPTGIHSSPSKRAKRIRTLSDRIKSSPLKKSPIRAAETSDDPPSPTPAKRLRSGKEVESSPKQPGSRKKPHKARNVPEEDDLAPQRATRDSLLDEIATLRRDLAVLNKQSERLYQNQQTRQGKAPVETFDQIENLIDVLCRQVLPVNEPTTPDATEEWLEMAMNPMAVLPFGISTALPLLLPSNSADDEEEEQERPPVSHLPVKMTAEEELPYLQLFSNLTFKSSMSIVPQDSNDTHVMQKHSISIASTPPGLFAAKLDLLVNTKKLSVAELGVPRLDPAAAGELGPFIKRILSSEHKSNNSGEAHIRNSALTRNASVIAWAMGEWVRLATKRARFWCAVERSMGTKEGIAESVKAMRSGKKRRRIHQRDSDDEDNDDNEGLGKNEGFTKAQIMPHLGRTSMDLDIPFGGDDDMPTVRVQWVIGFDWTGEGQSRMALQVEAPVKWHGQDSTSKLGKIPGVFDKLIADKIEPLEAIKTVVALLVGDE